MEEIEALGRQERRELENCLGVLIGHLLKWDDQPQKRRKSCEQSFANNGKLWRSASITLPPSALLTTGDR
ncbi:DUF29 family protein [Thermosynechococcus sp. Uc]|uniref:DUF29 family protein n=1 Tax=Thermosynechococcus sp. Uc TaxID=3034853 RepID=UPI00345BE485